MFIVSNPIFRYIDVNAFVSHTFEVGGEEI
jgi:hypothetical protein